MADSDSEILGKKRRPPLAGRSALLPSQTEDMTTLRCGDRRLEHIGRLRAFGSLYDVKFDVFSLLEGLETVSL